MNRIEEKKFDEKSDKEKFYILSMFPYPSGNLHMGHVRVYSISDTLARYQRLLGRNVIHPMGWDAFGLPAENAAIERNLDPKEWTQKNIEHMKTVMEKLNFTFDWNREFATCDSDYYKWTQFLFLKLYENGLVYRKEAFVNWDPVDKTVLADEQVIDGRSWRSGAIVEKKLLTQWFIRTTWYSQSLMDGLDDPVLQDWGMVAKMQRHWVGDSDGTTFDFEVVDNRSELKHTFMTLWMSQPEHIHKVRFVAVETDSVWNSGTVVSGQLPYMLRNPLSGDVIPVYATNFLPFPPGRDNYAGVPDEVECDNLYASSVNLSYKVNNKIIATEAEIEEYRRAICAEARQLGVGGYPTSSSIRDWLISRQRYWGTPIPIVYCDKCGTQAVPEEELPVKLPSISKSCKGHNILLETEEWVNTKCPKCGGGAVRETDTMDTFVDSSWYFLRYLDPDNVNAPFDVNKAKKYMPVDLYIGGKEHATLHLYYARFMSHFLHSAGLLPHREPFKRLLPQGIVRGKSYRLESTGEYIRSSDVEYVDEVAVQKSTGEKVLVEWEKMSKSKLNGVEPEELIKKFGADSTRLTILADVGPGDERNWTEGTFQGILNWQRRIWDLIRKFRTVRTKTDIKKPKATALEEMEKKFFDSRNYGVDMVQHSLTNTLNISFAIRKCQSILNDLKSASDAVIMYSVEYERALAVLIILMAPMAPCFASECWAGFVSAPNRLNQTDEIKWDKPVFQQTWPKIDSNYISKFSTRKGTIKNRAERLRKEKRSVQKLELNAEIG